MDAADFAHLSMPILSHVAQSRGQLCSSLADAGGFCWRCSAAAAAPCTGRVLRSRLWSTSKHPPVPAEQVLGCLHPSGDTDLFSITRELTIRSSSRVNTVYFGARSVWENTFPILREEFSQFTNCSMFYRVLNYCK